MDSNLATKIFSLIEEGKLKSAEKRCKKALKQGADAADCVHFLAVIELHRGNSKKAEALARDSLRHRSENASALNTLALALKEQRKFSEALSAVEQALLLSPGQLDISLNKIDFLVSLGEMNEASKACLDLYESHPNDARVGYKLVRTMRWRGGHEKAPEILQSLLKDDPQNVEYLVELANALDAVNRREEAISRLTSAVEESEPDPRLLVELAYLKERTNDLQSAERYAKQAQTLDQRNPRNLLTLAKINRRNTNYGEALDYLLVDGIEIGSGALKAEFEYEKGSSCDALGQYDDAFRYWSEANSIVEEVYDLESTPWWKESSVDHNQLADQQMLQRFSRSDCSPVFMIGFPRSGTTLLQTLIDQHSSVAVIDEGPAINETLNKLEKIITVPRYPESIPHLSNNQMTELSEYYLGLLEADADTKMVIDQNPFNGLYVPLILAMFRNPKFIFSVRHPYDVCLSAFTQNFRMNSYTFEFLSMDSTVQFYEFVMNIWFKCLSTYQIDWCAVKYEDLVNDRETELRKVTGFLDLDWERGILNEENRIESHKEISTVSYQQVSKPIYDNAVFRWKHYEQQLEPYKEVLAPFVERFGYEPVS